MSRVLPASSLSARSNNSFLYYDVILVTLWFIDRFKKILDSARFISETQNTVCVRESRCLLRSYRGENVPVLGDGDFPVVLGHILLAPSRLLDQ